MSKQRVLDPNLFSWPANEIHLYAGRHRTTGQIIFPAPLNDDAYERITLGSRGTLWTYTIQRFALKSPPFIRDDTPETFRPFAVGYVELPGEVRVETRLTNVDLNAIRIGMPLRLTTEVLHVEPDGTEIITYAFEPDPDAEQTP